MAKLRFLCYNAFDDATLSSSSSTTGYSVGNLQKNYRGAKWRTATLATSYVSAHLASMAAKCVGLTGFNFGYDAQITVKGNASDGTWDSPEFEQTFNVFSDFAYTSRNAWEQRRVDGDNWRSVSINYFSAEETHNWWRIEIMDPTNSDGYMEIGRAYLGDYFEPTYNMVYGPGIGVKELSAEVKTPDGVIYGDILPIYHKGPIYLKYLSNIEYQREMGYIMENFGVRKYMFIDLYPDDDDVAKKFFGKFYGILRAQTPTKSMIDRNEIKITFEETL